MKKKAKRSKRKANLYVDGFVLVVPKKNLAIYKRMASAMGKLCRKYGVLEYKECVGDDLKKLMKDPVLAKMPKKMPFDMKRLSYGGFKTIVSE